MQEQTQKADTRLNIALDAISEFRVSTGVYTAESGAAGGAQVNVVSKTGTNQYHGRAFYALRNDALDARSPFDDPTTGLPPFTLHQFGASLGGPLKQDKLFFFAAWEGQRTHENLQVTRTVPSMALRAGTIQYLDSNNNLQQLGPSQIATMDPNCTAQGTCPLGPGVNPAVLQVLATYPQPNSTAADPKPAC